MALLINSKISIVTIVYNDTNNIEQTILSVLDQKYADIEYIIIDGGSTDGTIDIIYKYETKISYWITEPDMGIFDAMNKGLKIATGEWIIFMNCGDSFYNNEVLSNVFKNNVNDINLIYGNVELFSNSRRFIVKQKCTKYSINLNSICHQTVFIRLSKHSPFNLDYKLTADHDIIFETIRNGHYMYVDIVIAKVLLGGVSYNVFKTSKEKLLISYRRGNFLDKILSPLFNIYQIIKFILKKIMVRILPAQVFERIASLKSKMESFV